MTERRSPTGSQAEPSSTVTPDHIDVLVVAYGAPELLEHCLERLEDRFAVVVIDNSSESSVRAVAEKHGATYVDPGRNLGFAAGVNLGLARRVPGHDVLLLNPDAAIAPDEVLRLDAHLGCVARLACVAPAQVDPETNQAARVGWPFPSPGRAWLDALGLGSLASRADFLIGSVLLLRAAAIDDVGLFDEQFFLYAEEADWQRRASDRGWEVGLCEESRATHVGAGTGGDESERDTHFHGSNERYIRKHHGVIGWWIFRTGVIAGALVRALLLPGDRGRRAGARFRLYLKGPVRAESELTGSTPPPGP
jgi:GT2 family glycosyltransferase